jgi:pyrroloquinoline quinone biosynthesis protein B
MQIRILGSAAGGGFPQWNCACSNCSAVRAGTFAGKPRTQAQVAISNDGESWFLLGASPDLRGQIEATPELHPRAGLRQTPIAGVVLTNADLDHVLGLLLLRELQPLRVFGTASVLQVLREDNSFFGMLNRVPRQVEWSTIVPGMPFELTSANGRSSGMAGTAVTLGTRYPAYVSPTRAGHLQPKEAVTGFIVGSTDESTAESFGEPSGRRLAYLSAVGTIDDALIEMLSGVDAILFDGTFWSDDELIRIESSGATAHQMGHVPVGGPGGSLTRLARLRNIKRIFTHINNTNPMLNESGPEHREVRDAGWDSAEDGWQFTL